MAVELRLQKLNNEPWGFRLTGGVEYDVPLTVVKVIENSIAEKCGLLINDVIVRVNDTSTAGLTHNEAHDLLVSSGNNLVLGVRRDLCSLVPSVINVDDEANEEIANIMQASLENEENLMLQKHVDYEIIHPTDESNNISRAIEYSAQVISETEKETTINNNVQTLTSVNERKWTTFLQKPTNPKPKKVEELPKKETYRVIIKKQKKKSLEENKQSQKEEIDEKQDITSEKIEGNEENTNVQESLQFEDENGNNQITPEDTLQAEDTEEAIRTEDDDKNEDVENELELTDNGQEQTLTNGALDKLLEEKLLEVQKQLEVLSHLPSTIQSTIDAVSKQLATIVQIKSSVNETEEIEISETNFETENNVTEEDYNLKNEEQEEEIAEDHRSVEEENQDENQNNEERTEDNDEENAQEDTASESIDVEKEPTEEEIEAKRAEEELLEKKQKVNQWNQTWPWSDEKKRIYRINFLKYQPPPKNLDYLQASDVYRMVHELEPPVRGISNRASKILAEQDYYQAG